LLTGFFNGCLCHGFVSWRCLRWVVFNNPNMEHVKRFDIHILSVALSLGAGIRRMYNYEQ